MVYTWACAAASLLGCRSCHVAVPGVATPQLCPRPAAGVASELVRARSWWFLRRRTTEIPGLLVEKGKRGRGPSWYSSSRCLLRRAECLRGVGHQATSHSQRLSSRLNKKLGRYLATCSDGAGSRDWQSFRLRRWDARSIAFRLPRQRCSLRHPARRRGIRSLHHR